MQKVVEYEGAKVTLEDLTYGESLRETALYRRFAPTPPADVPDDDLTMNIARGNYIAVAVRTRKTKGVTITTPTRDMTDEQFEAAFEEFMNLPNRLVRDAIAATNDLETPAISKATLPPERLTEAELKDPNS